MVAAAIIGAAGLGLIKEHEGLRTKAYLDPVGIPTICYGHTGPDVKMGQTRTVAQCEALLLQDIAIHRAGIEKCITRPLNPNQRDAVVSFAFNLGVSKTCKSTLVRHLNAGKFTLAAAEFPKWKNGRKNGALVPLPGLVKRRAAEQALFLQPYSEASYWGSKANIKALVYTGT